jgi:hypothetical protein
MGRRHSIPPVVTFEGNPGVVTAGPSHDDDALFTVYLFLHESVSKIGISKTCDAFAGRVVMPDGKKKYRARGLEKLYGKAKTLIESDPKLSHIVKLAEDTRAGRLKPLQIIGDEIPEIPAAGAVPDITKLSEEETLRLLRERRGEIPRQKRGAGKRR